MAPSLDVLSSAASNARAQAQAPTAGGDDLDDLFDYDVDLAHVFRDIESPKPVQSNEISQRYLGGGGLGIDEEVEVVKKPRIPRVKLDENKLLSQAGIPRLRKRAKDLKFKGKGHEYSDAARLLSFYQLWLDDLFPKARFLDALAMVEKQGHKKRMQMMRMEWINEGKPKEPQNEDSIFDEPILPPRQNPNRTETATRVAPIFERQLERPKTPDMNGLPFDNIYDATPTAPVPAAEKDAGSGVREGISLFGLKRTITSDEPEDDLDALLAEELNHTSTANENWMMDKEPERSYQEDDFDDDMEAMAEMEMEGM